MTAATLSAEPALATTGAPSWRQRVWNVVKLQAADPWTTIYLPALITVAIFGVHYVIYQTVVTAAGGVQKIDEGALQTSGGSSWIGFYLMVTAIQAMNLTFRFALGLSVTRRDYFTGTALYFVMLSIGFAIAITAAAAVERATDGWGLDARFFAPGLFNDHPLWVVAYGWVMFLLTMFGIGVASAAVYVRWKSNGIVLMFVALAFVIAGAVWFTIWSDSWGAVGRFFTERSLVEIFTWTLVITVPAHLAGYLLLRRATPRE